MKVDDLPLPATHALYDEAMTRYAQMVQSRAISVYRLGQVSHPGLSDAKLLVVIDKAHVDNRYFFSALQRLPDRLRAIFLHEPFVLPVWSLRVMRYTTHRAPALLAGRDVLHQFTPCEEPDERWCRVLESFCRYAELAADASATQTLHARPAISAASDLRWMLADADGLLTGVDGRSYAARIDALQDRFFQQADPEQAVRELWTVFCEQLAHFETRLRDRLHISDGADAVSSARLLLRGDEKCDVFDRDYAFRRARDIDGYHHEVASLGLPFGHLFSTSAHPYAVRALPDARVISGVVRNFYRMRRLMGQARA
jgi:hypothetical protein